MHSSLKGIDTALDKRLATSFRSMNENFPTLPSKSHSLPYPALHTLIYQMWAEFNEQTELYSGNNQRNGNSILLATPVITHHYTKFSKNRA